MRMVIGLIIWVLGCLLFIEVLKLTGPWLMLGGVATDTVAKIVDDHLKP